jgi:hypothetical protein
MKKIAGLLFFFAFCLMAADFWQKPYTEWADKDLQKMMTNSPWAHTASVSMGGPAVTPEGGGGGGRGGGGGGRGGGGPQGGGGGGGDADAPVPGVREMEVVARWQSAMPIRQAFVRLKYGAEAAKSDDAQKFLAKEQPTYELVLSGPMQQLLRGGPEDTAKALSEVTFLSTKEKGAVKPASIQVGKSGRSMDILIAFPRSMPYTLDDKEVEFSTKLGTAPVKIKFRLKDMVYNGKLEM